MPDFYETVKKNYFFFKLRVTRFKMEVQVDFCLHPLTIWISETSAPGCFNKLKRREYTAIFFVKRSICVLLAIGLFGYVTSPSFLTAKDD